MLLLLAIFIHFIIRMVHERKKKTEKVHVSRNCNFSDALVDYKYKYGSMYSLPLTALPSKLLKLAIKPLNFSFQQIDLNFFLHC